MEREIIYTLPEVDEVAALLIQHIGNYKKVAFYGSMGTGKTTLITAICKKLGSTDSIASPTFSIINEYLFNGSESIFHFDFYRIKKIEEVYDIGLEDYLYSKSFCFMEWPELIEELLPEDTLKIYITENNSENRILKMVYPV